MRGNWHKPKHRELPLKLRNCFHSKGWLSTKHRMPSKVVVSYLRDNQKSWAWATGSRCPYLNRDIRLSEVSSKLNHSVIMPVVPYGVSLLITGRCNQHSVHAREACLHASWYIVASFVLFCYCLLAPYSQTLCICLPLFSLWIFCLHIGCWWAHELGKRTGLYWAVWWGITFWITDSLKLEKTSKIMKSNPALPCSLLNQTVTTTFLQNSRDSDGNAWSYFQWLTFYW